MRMLFSPVLSYSFSRRPAFSVSLSRTKNRLTLGLKHQLALAVAQHARTQPLAHSPRMAIMFDDISAFISVNSLTARH